MTQLAVERRPPAPAQNTELVTGILDLRDGHGFLRLRGYLPSPDDVYVPPGLIRRHGLRAGDQIDGASGEPHGDKQSKRDKHRPLVRVDTINGLPPELAAHRPDFQDLTPLYPQERIRLETAPHVLTTRIMDMLTPIGKGQRALVVSPPKAGKTMVLHAIAHAIGVNHPECHVMALLVDERPEEVTDMRRSMHGEVIASTFDRAPSEHIAVAELTIERAKRLVEQGRDVVLLLDSITRLARAYNHAAPSNGRTLSGGIDSNALHMPKRLLGAARNVEGGGSLTIIATALVETGSLGDTLTFEEFKSTGNAEFRLMRAMAERRVFPAVDVAASGTRREEMLLNPDELAVIRLLRKALAGLEPQQAVEQLLDRLLKTGSNAEFLMQLARRSA